MKTATPDEYLPGRILKSHLLVTILVTLSATLSIVINGLIAGRVLGGTGLAVFGLATPVLILISAVAGIFGNGGTIICSRYLGSGDDRPIRSNFTVTMMFTVITGAVLTILFVFGSGALATGLGANGALSEDTKSYIAALGLSALPLLIAQNLLLYIRMDGSQKLALVAIFASIVTDTAFALWSAQGSFGITGIGLAIGISNIVSCVICAAHFLKKNHRLGFAKPENPIRELKTIVSAGLPTAINRGSQTLKNLVLNNFLMIVVGTGAVISLSVQTNIYQFTISICTGYGLMVAMMCGMFYGDRDRKSITTSLRLALRSGILVSAVVAVVMIFFAPEIAALFIKDGGNIEECTLAVRLFMISLPTSTACLIILYMNQTLGNLMLTNAISLTRGFIYVVLVSVALFPILGTTAVWISFVLADILSILTVLVMVRFKTGRFPRTLDDLVYTPHGFDGVEEIYTASVGNDMDQVMESISSIEEACLSSGVDREKASRIALCIEEMAGNIVRHAFDDEKEHFMDIRIIRASDGLIFRIRDDGKKFNPMQYESQDHLGIRTMRAAAKDVNYSYSVGLNNLTIRV